MESASMVRTKEKWTSIALPSIVANVSTADSHHTDSPGPVGFWRILHTHPQRLQLRNWENCLLRVCLQAWHQVAQKLHSCLRSNQGSPMCPRSSEVHQEEVPQESPGYWALSPQLSWDHRLPIRTSFHWREQAANLCPSAKSLLPLDSLISLFLIYRCQRDHIESGSSPLGHKLIMAFPHPIWWLLISDLPLSHRRSNRKRCWLAAGALKSSQVKKKKKLLLPAPLILLREPRGLKWKLIIREGRQYCGVSVISIDFHWENELVPNIFSKPSSIHILFPGNK